VSRQTRRPKISNLKVRTRSTLSAPPVNTGLVIGEAFYNDANGAAALRKHLLLQAESVLVDAVIRDERSQLRSKRELRSAGTLLELQAYAF